MNDNSGETANPLNPSPKSIPVTGTGNQPVTQHSAEAISSMPSTQAMGSGTMTTESLDPTGRPMEKQIEAPEQPKKPKVGIIAAIIAGCVLLIGGIIAAVVIMMGSNKNDAVAAAMQKIMNGETPRNVAIDGTIDILLNNRDVPFKRINVNLDSDIMVGSAINTSSAVLTFTDNNDKDYSIKFDELYAANDDLYFKIEGAANALKESGILNLISGINEMDESSAAIFDGLIGVIESAEGTFLRVSSVEMDSLKNEVKSNSTLNCVTDLVNKVNKNSNTTLQLYSKYPFIASTDKNIPIVSKQNPIYQVWLDDEMFSNFVNEINNTELVQSLYACLDWSNNVSITKEDVANITGRMPKVYAEVNSDNNFTRLYLESDIENGVATATIDLGFSYPTNINVSEPVEYTNFSDFLQTIFKSMYQNT